MDILNAIFPVFVLLLLGAVLKKAGITNDIFLKTSDRLVYFIFFPAMLFWKIGSTRSHLDGALNLCLAGILSVAAVYLASLAAVRILPVPRPKAGAFSQACYRFNTYIGMAVIMTAMGEQGVRYFGVLIGFAIPVINLLAVATLIWYAKQKQTLRQTLLRLIKALIGNPLILGCAAGLVFSRLKLTFPAFIDNTFTLMTAVTMPMALISIGGSLTLSGLGRNLKIASAACTLKIIILPTVGYCLLKLFCVSGIPFRVGMIFFTLPASTAIYVLSAQLNSDTQTASAAIFLSTALSFASLSVALLL